MPISETNGPDFITDPYIDERPNQRLSLCLISRKYSNWNLQKFVTSSLKSFLGGKKPMMQY